MKYPVYFCLSSWLVSVGGGGVNRTALMFFLLLYLVVPVSALTPTSHFLGMGLVLVQVDITHQKIPFLALKKKFSP